MHVARHDHLVISGGISGLSAAHDALEKGESVIVLEASPRAGGVIQTLQHEDPATGHRFLLETGPHTFPASAHALIQLARRVGVEPQPVSSSAKRRYVVKHGRLCPVPMDPLSFLTSPLLSPRAKAYLLAEPFRGRFQPSPVPEGEAGRGTGALSLEGADASNYDPPVSAWISHRLGPEVLDWLVAPFLSGIYAGDPQALGARSIFPKLLAWEDAHGSVFKGALQALTQKKSTSKASRKASSTTLLGFPNGMQTLTDALVNALPENVLRLNTRVNHLERNPDGSSYDVWLDSGECLKTKTLTVAVPAPEAARLLMPLLPEAHMLSEIPYAPVAVVHVAVPLNALRQPLDGFGFLVPRQEQTPLLGCIWASALFPNRAPRGEALLSCVVGGMTNPDAVNWDDAQLMASLRPALTRYHHAVDPDAFRLLQVIRWPRAIPQYNPGHPARMSALVNAMAHHLPGVTLRGNYGFGIALNACVQPMTL